MKRVETLIISILFLIGFWYFSDTIFNFEIGGVDIPFLGHIDGWKPFASLSSYGVLVGGILALLIHYSLTKRGMKE